MVVLCFAKQEEATCKEKMGCDTSKIFNPSRIFLYPYIRLLLKCSKFPENFVWIINVSLPYIRNIIQRKKYGTPSGIKCPQSRTISPAVT